MRLLLDLARGMLTRRLRQTLVSVTGIALGVAFFIATAAIMRGFQTYFVTQIIDVSPHITIKDETRRPTAQAAELAHPDGAVLVHGVKPRDRVRGIRNAGQKVAILEAMEGVAAAPVLQAQSLLRYGSRDVSAVLTGLEPDRHRRVSNIEEDMIAGTLDDLRRSANGIIVGEALAWRLGIGMGDTLSAVAPSGTVLSMKVVGLFRTGIQAVDQGHGFALLKVAQVLADRPNVVNQILIRLADVTQAEPLARQIEARFGDRTESWEEQSANILTVFVIQNAIMFSVTGAILLVAAFGIYNVISTVVIEKTRDIAILKSLGFTEGDIQLLFLVQGIVAGLLGALVGCALGALMIEGLALVRFGVNTPSGQGQFLLDRDIRVYLLASLFAMIAAALASVIPARRASRLDPVQVVRGAA
ncbi:ABC transporter permease [Roseomonas frigidaquae]|uniref:ABC transporter permease n=1 Tax=Falsiroseomonas frigidaquae TaxID=487318 RepID=A0ABX1EV79_9PROT|nr:ABC transporter permease [Falsiroseomonas frigidaquae]NKE43914.1 ABC transporter permease [Falsiroseomonas frigidaquae]